MGRIIEVLDKLLPMSDKPSFYPIGEDLDGSQSPEIYQEPPLPDDPALREKRQALKHGIFEVANQGLKEDA